MVSPRVDGLVRREAQRPPVAQSRDAVDDVGIVERLVVKDVVVGLTLHARYTPSQCSHDTNAVLNLVINAFRSGLFGWFRRKEVESSAAVGLCCMHEAPVHCLLGFLFGKNNAEALGR